MMLWSLKNVVIEVIEYNIGVNYMGASIIFIAPDDKLEAKAKSIISEKDTLVKVSKGSLGEGLMIAQEAIRNGTKVIISRGEPLI